MTAPAAGEVQRYDIYMHSDDVQFLKESADGDYMKFADHDALVSRLTRERDEAREALAAATAANAVCLHTSLIVHTGAFFARCMTCGEVVQMQALTTPSEGAR